MPGKRADGQVLIGAALEADMVALMDKARGGISRSQYVRQAIAEKLISEGYKVPSVWIYSPDRTGKGGRPKKVTIKVADKISGKAKVTQHNHFTTAPDATAPGHDKGPKGKRWKNKQPEK